MGALANVSDDEPDLQEDTDEDAAMDTGDDEETAEQAVEEEIPRRNDPAIDDTPKRLAAEASSALAVIERRRPVLEEPDSNARSRSGSNTIARRVPAASKPTPP